MVANVSKLWAFVLNWSKQLLFLAGFLVLSIGVYLAQSEVSRQETVFKEWGKVPVVPPSSPPPLTQESVDLALLFFGIKIPPDTEHPRFDRDLADRGVTVKPTFYGKSKVSVGPQAFTSWGVLGSTLAHEIEIHCNQSLLGIWVFDMLGLDGTHMAERVAYLHELKNKDRFGLRLDEEAMISETLDFYYPDKVEFLNLSFDQGKINEFLIKIGRLNPKLP